MRNCTVFCTCNAGTKNGVEPVEIHLNLTFLGQHLDTPKLYTVLMTSQLSKPALGHLWSLVNKETVGVLNLQESVMLLALVALVQVG